MKLSFRSYFCATRKLRVEKCFVGKKLYDCATDEIMALLSITGVDAYQSMKTYNITEIASSLI